MSPSLFLKAEKKNRRCSLIHERAYSLIMRREERAASISDQMPDLRFLKNRFKHLQCGTQPPFSQRDIPMLSALGFSKFKDCIKQCGCMLQGSQGSPLISPSLGCAFKVLVHTSVLRDRRAFRLPGFVSVFVCLHTPMRTSAQIPAHACVGAMCR